ncbi:hypothetical protein [Streptomyces sp. NBC_00690]|nr:hypothetical protein [Streptomyces sp. NBC_00690]
MAFETTALRDAVDPIGQLEESLGLFHAIGSFLRVRWMLLFFSTCTT